MVYSEELFRVLRELRARACAILDCLGGGGVYGSLARGDVHAGSDIDVVLFDPPPEYRLELALEDGGFPVTHREVVIASPNSPLKAHIHLGQDAAVSFPLLPMKRREEEFYRFGGYLEMGGLREGTRGPGVDKRLLLIEPTESGHIESGISGREPEVARLLGIGRDAVDERIRVLTRRDQVGRTGVYLRETLEPGESFGDRLRALASRDNSVKRQLRARDGRI